MGRAKAQKAERRKDQKKGLNDAAPVKQFSRKREAKPKQDPIVLSDDDDNRCEERSETAQESRKASLVFHKKHEGRWEESELSSDRESSRHESNSREDTVDRTEEASQYSGDSWRPSISKPNRGKARPTSPGGSMHIIPVGHSKGKKLLGGKTLSMPAAEWQLEDEGRSDKKTRPGSGKAKQKRGKQQEAHEPEVQAPVIARPAPVQVSPPMPAVKRRSDFFAKGAPSQAANSLKAFKKAKLVLSSSTAREGPADCDSAELATADLGIPGSGEGGRSQHATPVVSPRSRTTTASSPDEFYVSKHPHFPPAAAKACSPVSASVLLVASTPSPKSAEQGQSPPQRWRKMSQARPSNGDSKKLPEPLPPDVPPRAVSEASDRVGDWDPEGERRPVSSEAEAGSSPDPSSIVVEADDSPRPSQSAKQLQSSPPKLEESPENIIPETQEQDIEDDDQQGSVSIVNDTPEKTEWATGKDSDGDQPLGNLERGQEGCSAEQNVEQPGKERPMATPSHSKQKHIHEISSAFETELNALEKCNDTELKSRLPQMPESQEALALVSPQERRDKISAAMRTRDAERPSIFQKKLFENMDEKGAARRERANAPAASPLAARETQPKKSRKHTDPSAPAKKLTPSPEQPADMKVAQWDPPASPYFLIEEVLYDDPWKLLVACMLLNKTTGRAVRKILYQLFELCPTPEAAIEADTAVVESIIKPLGLFRKRAVMFKRFSREYIEKQWTDPRQLHGMGQYAADAFNLFCRNKWKEMKAPQDKDLLQYYTWLVKTNGLGCGYEREVFAMPSNSQSTSLKGAQPVIDICSPAVDSKAKAVPQKGQSPKQ